MPEYFYELASRISADRLVTIACVFVGLVMAPLLALSLDHDRLFGVALMAAAWWPVVLLLKFHPQRRALSNRAEDWFFALVLDAHAASVIGVFLLAYTKH
jgi:hypothetical protein